MSDERLDELRLPRREFLKRVVAGAFIVPVVVSFGLAEVAEAASSFHPNQSCPNQSIANQTEVDLLIDELIARIGYWRQQGGIRTRAATLLRRQLTQAGSKLDAGKVAAACRILAAIEAELRVLLAGRRIAQDTANDLSSGVAELQALLNCKCS